MHSRPLAIFDIDHTLLLVNSHYEFAERFLREHSRFRYWVYRLAAWEPMRKALSYLIGDDVRRHLSARLFTPYPRDRLAEFASKMIQANFEAWCNPTVMALVDRARARGCVIVTASATLDFIAEPVADLLRADSLSSIYERGAIAHDLTGKKLSAINERFPGRRIGLFVSDNIEDICDQPDHFVLVVGVRLFHNRSLAALEKSLATTA